MKTRAMKKRIAAVAAAPPGPRRPPRFERGYGWVFTRHIIQAGKGCDLNFLESSHGATPGEPAIL